MTNTEYPTFAVGDHVIIENRGGGWDGVTGVVKTAKGEGKDGVYWVEYDDPQTTPLPEFDGGSWTADGGYLSLLAPAPSLKASLTHDTSREYADHALSRSLPPWANEILAAAANGEKVDVVEFRKAATQALSLAATRAGQGRRQWTREARHLIYWADAIIDNHLKGIPPYEGGPRSPRIFALEQEISHLKQAAADERRRLCNEINDLQESRRKAIQNVQDAAANEVSDLKRSANEAIDDEKARSLALIKEKTDLEITVEHLYSEINESHAALEYAFTLLSNADQARLAGFRDGYATRVNDES